MYEYLASLATNGVAIGPNSTFIKPENDIKSNLHDVSNNITFNGPAINKNTHDHDTEDDHFPYVAKALHEMENLRQLNVTDNINEHVSKLMDIENELMSRMVENLKLSKEEMCIKNKLKTKIIENSVHSEDLVVSQKMNELIKKYTDNKLKGEEKLANEAIINVTKNEEIKLRNQRIEMLCRIQQEYHNIHKQILDNALDCKNRPTLISQISSDFHRIQELTSSLSSVLQSVNVNNVEDRDVETCQMVLQCATVIAEKLKKTTEQINLEENELTSREQEAVQIQESTIVPEVVQITETEKLKEPQAENSDDLGKCVFEESLVYYTTLEEELNQFSKLIESFVNSAPSKDFLRKLKISIKTTVNTVCPDSALMREKFTKISNFLRGNFHLQNTPMPNLPKHTYFPFVVDVLCKHFIDHAEKQFRSKNPQKGFILASLAVAIWSEFPQFGVILLANIMKKCPYIIPAYWPRYSGQTDREYFESLGYQYKNDEIENEESFIDRMTGIFMLYISLMVTISRRNRAHPYGIENGWKWIASLVNLEPRPNITTSLLHVFLEICACKMNQYYGFQFRKIIQLLIDEYIEKIEKVTSENFLGHVNRLKLYIEKLSRQGFREPEGILSAEDWI